MKKVNLEHQDGKRPCNCWLDAKRCYCAPDHQEATAVILQPGKPEIKHFAIPTEKGPEKLLIVGFQNHKAQQIAERIASETIQPLVIVGEVGEEKIVYPDGKEITLPKETAKALKSVYGERKRIVPKNSLDELKKTFKEIKRFEEYPTHKSKYHK